MLSELASFWYVYLLIAFSCWGYAFINQVLRMKRMSESFQRRLDFTGRGFSGNDFTKGLMSMALASLSGAAFFVLFLVALAFKAIEHFGAQP